MIKKIKAIYILISMITTIGILVIALFFAKKRETKKKIRSTFSGMFIKMSGIKYEVIGRLEENSGLIIANHQSYLDIIVFESFTAKDLCWIAKEELKKLPYFGSAIINADMIFVKRGHKESLPKMILDAKDKLSQDRVITIFPEGTRNNGNDLLRFKRGPKFLIKELGTTMQPLIILNTNAVFDLRDIFSTENRVIKYIFLEPYEADFENKHWYEEFEDYYKKEYLRYKQEDDNLYITKDDIN